MPGVLLFLPFLLVRFGLLAAKNRQALPRAAHFAPMQGREKIAYAVYQLATLGDPPGPVRQPYPEWQHRDVVRRPGPIPAGAGSVRRVGPPLCRPGPGWPEHPGDLPPSPQPHVPGVFCLLPGDGPAHPVLGTAALVLVFQGSAHWIILAEEWWCQETFGEAYRQYRGRVRRYL